MIWSTKSIRQQAELTSSQSILFKTIKLPPSAVAIFLEALTHTSFGVENNTKNYERLEFLGDAVLNTYTAIRLFSANPNWTEGELTRARASIVSEPSLAKLARSMNVANCIRLGKGESHSGGSDKDKILADVMESPIAVIFLAKGQVFTYGYLDKLDIVSKATMVRDGKSELQNLIQGKGQGTPVYRIVSSSGPSHNPIFKAEVTIGNNVIGQGTGKTKKEAEQNSALEALKNFKS